MTAPRSLPKALKDIRVSSAFGIQRKINGKWTPKHNGVDWATPTGLPLEAAFDGKVALKGGSNTHIWGYFIHLICNCPLKHTQEFHILRELPSWLEEGDSVKAGDLIGYTGSSGSLNGKRYYPHHHHGFTVNGVHYDPLTVGWPDLASNESEEFNNETPEAPKPRKKKTMELYSNIDQNGMCYLFGEFTWQVVGDPVEAEHLALMLYGEPRAKQVNGYQINWMKVRVENNMKALKA